MNWPRKIDDSLFACVFQPVCNRLVDITTPRRIALFCVSGMLVLAAVEAGWRHMQGDDGRLIGLGIRAGVAAIIYAQTAFTPELSRRGRNPRRVSFFSLGLRLTCVCFSSVDAILVGMDIALELQETAFVIAAVGRLCFTAFLYFDACDKPPPAERHAPAEAVHYRSPT